VADLIEDEVDLGERVLSILRPPDAEALLDEEAFDREEFLPYWAELWPSGVALAREVSVRSVEGLHVAELGSGLGLPSLAAALGGACVLATDWSPDAIDLLRRNAARNGVELELLVCSWSEPAPLLARAPFDLVLASDVLYERRNVDQLLELLPQLVGSGEVMLADPGRPHLRTFLDRAAVSWEITVMPRPQERAASLAVYTLRARAEP
jgi:predicted nicotinamide N-methyase